MRRIVEWLDEAVRAAHALVKALDANLKLEELDGCAYVLVAETAANVLIAFTEVEKGKNLFANSARLDGD